MENFRKWKRIALVTDTEWMHHMTSLFGWMTPGEMKTFPASELDQAIAWVSDSATVRAEDLRGVPRARALCGK